ncbi:MAG TPA: rhamnulokinase family protein [Bacillota bacterium]|nr:rhamnulokinase family protein [Bacillota bacterium]
MDIKNIVGLDCGNSSFRVVLGKYDGKTLETEVIDQTPNGMIRIGEYYYWDMLRIFEGFIASLKKAVKRVGKIDSIGICTWGVDFSMFDRQGNMIGNTLSYRNPLGEVALNKLTESQKREMFYQTGILCDKINSIYRLSMLKDIMPDMFSIADKVLMVPDILNYFLTGVMINEPSELSTTQLMDSKTRKISPEICKKFNIPEKLFCEIGEHGKQIGKVQKYILDEIEADYDIPVICVPSHDTASAVVAIPAREKDFVFISSGTWSLIGTETDEPYINDDILNASLTNELGAFNKITLLKNSAGMFIIQRVKKEYDAKMNRASTWDELNELGAHYKGPTLLFNVNNIRFFNPPKMCEAIWNYLIETNQVQGMLDWGAIIRAINESMACSYAVTVKQLERSVSKRFSSIYIAGGGSKNIMVNRLTAQRTGKPVYACSSESTVLGNIASQLKAIYKEMDLPQIREVIGNSISINEYREALEGADVVERYEQMP